MAINFFEEDLSFKLPDKGKHKNWLKLLASEEAFKIKDLNYIFCSDEYLYQINVDYLNHDTYTDIITFDNSERDKELEGDIFISITRVQDNAKQEDQIFETELRRVLAHGLLHLMGYGDKTELETAVMREKENQSLSKYIHEKNK